MAGVEQGGGQPQPEQPKQPEQTQPQQGRAEGRRSLQGPTTVEVFDWLQQEREASRNRYLEEMRGVFEKDGNIFATRAMEGLDALLADKIPHAERERDFTREKMSSRLKARWGNPDMQVYNLGIDKVRGDGYVEGLEDAFKLIRNYILGEQTQEPKK